MSVIIGIDLGTTNFAVCTVENGRPKLLQDAEQNRTFPSAIFRKNDQWIVGHTAKTARLKDPTAGAYAVKRLMGVKYDSEERRVLEKTLGLTLSPRKNGEILIEIGGQIISPSHAAAEILKFCRELTVQNMGEEPEEVVITVPAYFNHSQREATKKAAEIAGIPCNRIINEPTAAAVAYGLKAKENSTVLVFDLGGGTFDVSILKFSNGIVETLATCGDSFLGGEDFDQLLIEMLMKEYAKQFEEELNVDFVVKQRLKDAAETAKIELSQQKNTMIFLPSLSRGRDLQMTLSRAAFEEVSKHLVDKTLKVVQTALSDAELTEGDVDQYILVGGQTRMPLVQEELTRFFHKKPQRSVHPDEVVAIGAAVHASSLQGEIDAPMLFDVTPFNLGIDIQAGLFQTIISKNSRVPISATKSFLVRKGQSSTQIVVRQGHARFSNENEFLGEFSVNRLKPRKDGMSELEVNFRIDANGMLNVTARDVVSGRKVNLKMRNYGEFIREDIEAESESDSYGDWSEESSSAATIGIGDSSDSVFGAGQYELEEKENALQQLEEMPTEQELDIANSLTGDSPEETNDFTTLEDELAYLSSLVEDIEMGNDKEEKKDGLAMALDLSWLEEFEDSEEESKKKAESAKVTSAKASAKKEEAAMPSPDEYESEEELFVLTPDQITLDEEDEIFELIPEEGSVEGKEETVSEVNQDEVEDLLDQILFGGFEEQLDIPDDDFFHGLTAIMTGKVPVSASLQHQETQIVVEQDDKLEGLSREMLQVLEELFA